jgi:hypothetical protein
MSASYIEIVVNVFIPDVIVLNTPVHINAEEVTNHPMVEQTKLAQLRSAVPRAPRKRIHSTSS